MSDGQKLALVGTCKACEKEFIEKIESQTGIHIITCECGETLEVNLDELTAVDMAADHPRLDKLVIPESPKYGMDPRTRSTRAGLLAAGMVAMAAFGPGMGDIMGGTMFGRSGYREPKKPRPCLNCKKPHIHNNSFCSAECCKEYRAKKS